MRKDSLSLDSNRFLRFLLAGAINTLFGFFVYAVAILARAPVWLALLIAVIAGTAFNFVTTSGYVFRDLSLGRVPVFVLCYLLVYGVNLALLDWLVAWLGGEILTQAVLAFPMAVLSYTLMARLVFTTVRKEPKCDP